MSVILGSSTGRRRSPGRWVGGDSLALVLESERAVRMPARTLEASAALLQPVAVALAASHERGIWHLELTPDVLVVAARAPGGPCATAARLGSSRAGEPPSSSPGEYLAPEQFSEAYGLAGPWTDVFSLALIFVEAVTGHRSSAAGVAGAATGKAALDSFRRRRAAWAGRGARVPTSLDQVLATALALYPAERFQTVGSFWRALSDALALDAGKVEAKSGVAARPLERRSTLPHLGRTRL
jgi:hypothetical protein